MDIRLVTAEDGAKFIAKEDVVGILRQMADDYLTHIPGHVEIGEFYEALVDRHAAFILDKAADDFGTFGELVEDES